MAAQVGGHGFNALGLQAEVREADRAFDGLRAVPAVVVQLDELQPGYLKIDDPGFVLIVMNLEGFGQSLEL
ncbi:hypothetical protein ACVNS2_01415 [Paenibacillus caseinilyticus]|uniref:Uncharacterized protein n=1 Tax=Paenibacillus mucilaginosus K02 TaxID=997761 RepID=R9UPJ4_9BACL|nr:hypothetical protein [Paenibacillus mucilaginosus]AGN70545.1 hypothetical protein B2K_38295 [Paenibacillus mucilaginosus K02]